MRMRLVGHCKQTNNTTFRFVPSTKTNNFQREISDVWSFCLLLLAATSFVPNSICFAGLLNYIKVHVKCAFVIAFWRHTIADCIINMHFYSSCTQFMSVQTSHETNFLEFELSACIRDTCFHFSDNHFIISSARYNFNFLKNLQRTDLRRIRIYIAYISRTYMNRMASSNERQHMQLETISYSIEHRTSKQCHMGKGN